MRVESFVLLACFVFILASSQIVDVNVTVKVEVAKDKPKGPDPLPINTVLSSSSQNQYKSYLLPKKPFTPPPPMPPKIRQEPKEVAGIIISIHHGYSYDELFSKVKQESKDGSVVLTYLTTSDSEKALLEGLNENYTNVDKQLRQIIGEINKLSPNCSSCIVFNWQCSSGFSDQKFRNNGKEVFGLVDLIIKRGHIGMFSDFSLKALINQWDSQFLGPNPFVKVGETSTAIKLKFKKDRLIRSPSSQLQAIGHLAASDELSVRVLGGTILYAVDSRVSPRQKYQLEVLTIASNFRAPKPELETKIDDYSGLAGHVLLSYKEGGKIITSMGHWIQLMKINTSEQQLFKATETLYGSAELAKVKLEYSQLSTAEQKSQYQAAKSVSYVQNQSPGVNNFLKMGKL